MDGTFDVRNTRVLGLIEKGMKDYSEMPTQRRITRAGGGPTWNDQASTNTYKKGGDARSDKAVRNNDVTKRSGVLEETNLSGRNRPEQIPFSDMKFDPSQAAVELRRELTNEVFEAVGFLPSLRSEAAPGQTVKVTHAAWVDSWAQPLVDIVAEQITAAIEADVSIDMAPARLAQATDQAIVVAKLTAAGMSLEEAEALAGF